MKKIYRLFLFVIMLSLFLVGISTLKITLTSTSVYDKEASSSSKCIEINPFDYSYNLIFNTNGGNSLESIEIKIGKTDKYLPTPVKKGFKFIGWYYDSEFVFPASNKTLELTHVKDIDSETNCAIGYKDSTLYAKWQEDASAQPTCPNKPDEVFDIIFVTNGGDYISNMSVRLFQYGGPNLPTPTRFNYKFEGWYYDKTFDRKAPISSDEVKTLYLTDEKGCDLGPQDIELYAKWTKTEIHCTDPLAGTFRLIYDSNGGNTIAPTVLSTSIRTNGPKLPVPVRKGYTFEGWYYENTYSQVVASTDVVIPPKMYDIYGCHTSWGDVTIYAKWKKNGLGCVEPKSGFFKLIFMSNGGTKFDSISLATNRVSEATIETPTKEGYKFLGWYFDSAFTKKASNTTSGITPTKKYDDDKCLIGWNNVYLYAKWIKKSDIPCETISNDTFVLKLNTNGGNNIKDITVNVKSSSQTALPAPTKSGYKFSAWYYDINYTKKVPSNIEEITTVKNIDSRGCEIGLKPVEIYAKWLTESGECIIVTEGSFKLEYDTNGGEDIKGIVLKSNRKTGEDLPTPVRKNYKFMDWYYDKDYTKKTPDNTKDIVTKRIIDADGCESGWEDIKIYAKWYSADSATLTGVLTDTYGNPLSKYIIEIQDSETIKTTTNEAGEYKLENVKSGYHTLYIKDEQNNPVASSDINLVRDGYTNVDMNVFGYKEEDNKVSIDIMLNKLNEINFITKESNIEKIIICIGIGVVVIALIILKTKKKKVYHFERK